MNLFFATFIPGLQNFISDVMRKRLSDVKIRKLLDGAVLFETETSYDKLNFFCFNNIFTVISMLEESRAEAHQTSGQRSRENLIEKYIKTLCNSAVNFNVISSNSKNIRTFRIVVSNENVPAAVDMQLRAETEKFISKLSGLKVNRSLPDTEFWFLYRSEGFCIFMKRLTMRSSWEKTLHKGELPPPLAWTLCSLAGLTHSDTALDPFCGCGSIPHAAVKYFHITKFTACDNSAKNLSVTSDKFKGRKTTELILHKSEFSGLPSIIGEKTIDVIVTDPPWGHFDKSIDSRFLEKMFEVFEKLLKDGGRAVVLYANDDSFMRALPSSFELQTQIPILLSGKKAVIYVMKK